MKTVISHISTAIFILLGIGCESSLKNDKTQLTISCKECAGLEVSLTRSDILPTGPKEVYQSKFDFLGRTKIEFTQTDTLGLLLVVGKKDDADWKFYTSLYFEPGTHIDLTIDKGQPKFEGDLKIVNSYYTKIYSVERERQEYANANFNRYMSATSSERQVVLDSLTKFGTAVISQIEKDNSISEYYRQMLLSYNSLFEITKKMHFDTQVARMERSNNDKSTFLDSTLSNAFNDLILHRNHIDNPSYTWYLTNRLQPMFDDILDYRYENNVKLDLYKHIKIELIKDSKLTEYRELLLAFFVAHMSYDYRMDYDLESKLIDSFQRDYPYSKYLKSLNYILAGYADLRSGMPMKDLEMKDRNGNRIKLSSLKGNLVYIDVWATWCGPCREELTYAPKLSTKYSNHPDLKFVYVSIDNDSAAWKLFLDKNPEIKGVHGIQNSSFVPDSSHISSLYKFNGIPRYILIDKHGNIVTTDAKRPTELLATSYLDSLLAL